MKRLLPLCAALLGGCTFQPDPGLKIVVPAMPTTLDWSHSDPTSWVNYPVMLATQKGLTALAPDQTVVPGLAERWTRERLEDGREAYTFFLRPDARWSNGAPLVAEDFVEGWRRALQGAERGELADLEGAPEVLALQERRAPPEALRAALARIGVRALDARTLRVTLTRPRSYFLARLANVYLFYPAPSADLVGKDEEEVRDYFDRPRDGRPLALGPFRVERWDRAGERVRLVHNPASVFLPPLGPGERHPAAVTLLRSELGGALYDRRRVDFIFVDSALALRGRLPEDLHREPLLSTYFLAFNTERSPLDRPEVRRLLACSLEPARLLEGLLPEVRLASGLLPPPLGAAEAARGRPALTEAEAAKASSLLGALKRPLRLVHRAGDSFVPEVAIAERLAAQLRARGVPVTVEARGDFSSEISRRAADGARAYDLYLRRVGADYAHPNSFFTLFERSGNHQTGWERLEGGAAQARFERLLDEADGEQDGARARRLYSEAESVLVREQAVIVPLYHPDRYWRGRSRLRGLGVDPFNFLSLARLRVGADGG